MSEAGEGTGTPQGFTEAGWRLAQYGEHRVGCEAGRNASKRHSLCNCGLSNAINKANGEVVSSSPGEGTGTLTPLKQEWWTREECEARLAAKDERIAELEAMQDAFDAGQEASLKGEPRETNPHLLSDSYGVGTLWLQWGDGYDCNINRKLKAELAAKDAQLAELHAEIERLKRG